jgi:hypothetical protein
MRQAALQIVEAMTPADQFTDDERRPALGDDL